MPKQTFFNLSEKKQNMIIEAALDEFSTKSYDVSSVNTICKSSGIAKGSFYQYFEDKLDLYLYLMDTATQKKLKVFQANLDFYKDSNFIDQIRNLFTVGTSFCESSPKLALLGEKLLIESNLQVKASVIKLAEASAFDFYSTWIDEAKNKGEINPNISTKALGLMIQSLVQAILNEQLSYYQINGKHMSKEALQTVKEELLAILSLGINNHESQERGCSYDRKA